MLVKPEAGEFEVHLFALKMTFVWIAFRWLNLAEELDGASVGRFSFGVGEDEAGDTAVSQ